VKIVKAKPIVPADKLTERERADRAAVEQLWIKARKVLAPPIDAPPLKP
jgi:hypothetical protein